MAFQKFTTGPVLNSTVAALTLNADNNDEITDIIGPVTLDANAVILQAENFSQTETTTVRLRLFDCTWAVKTKIYDSSVQTLPPQTTIKFFHSFSFLVVPLEGMVYEAVFTANDSEFTQFTSSGITATVQIPPLPTLIAALIPGQQFLQADLALTD